VHGKQHAAGYHYSIAGYRRLEVTNIRIVPKKQKLPSMTACRARGHRMLPTSSDPIENGCGGRGHKAGPGFVGRGYKPVRTWDGLGSPSYEHSASRARATNARSLHGLRCDR